MAGRPGLASVAPRGSGPRLINIFASWCLPCRVEAPQLAELQRRGVAIEGIAVRDRPEDLAGFLATYGDPFRAIGADNDRRVQLALGSAGVPETFIVGPDGTIRHVRTRASFFRDIDGTPKLIGAEWDVTSDVLLNETLMRERQLTESKNAELNLAKAHIEYAALHDSLTGLPCFD